MNNNTKTTFLDYLLMMDFYEITMVYALWKKGIADRTTVFDMFYRSNPDNASFAITAGLQEFIDFFQTMQEGFSESDINYLKELPQCAHFENEFFEYLLSLRFNCDISAIPEGTVVYPNEPLVIVKGKWAECQLIETALLLIINHQTMIASKANRVVRAARGRSVFDFGARRAHNIHSALYGARAAYIGGVDGTATTMAGKEFGIPVSGTMAHSFIQGIGNDYDAFKIYAEANPDNCTFLLDTFDVLNKGLPAAIEVAKTILFPQGKRLKGVRLDSGDLGELSKRVRQVLDAEGMTDCKIVASNSLNELIIQSLILEQESAIDVFGVGEQLIVSKSNPVFGGVYKLVAIEDEYGVMQPRIKLSEDAVKTILPGEKRTWRILNKDLTRNVGDINALVDEDLSVNESLLLFDPKNPANKHPRSNIRLVKLQESVFMNGVCVYPLISVENIRNKVKEQISLLPPTQLRLTNSDLVDVYMSDKLYDLSQELKRKALQTEEE